MTRLVEAARAYLGVKFRHRGRNRLGLDCAGLLKVTYRDCGINLPDCTLYGPEPNAGALEREMAIRLGDPVAMSPVRRSALQVGDVVLVRFKFLPHHVALLTDYPYGGLGVIHASGEAGEVIEHRLADDMIKRITHVFRKPV